MTSIILSNEKNLPRVFLCHASEDKEIANTLHGKLKEAGLDPWLDKEKLRGGSWFRNVRRYQEPSRCYPAPPDRHANHIGFRLMMII